MRRIINALAIAALLIPSAGAFAAKPVKIIPTGTGEDGGASFRNYIVECSNGKSKSLTSWDNGKQWCLGDKSREGCVKKQIKAAKAACKLN